MTTKRPCRCSTSRSGRLLRQGQWPLEGRRQGAHQCGRQAGWATGGEHPPAGGCHRAPAPRRKKPPAA
ncbi:MAG: hypothetical protein MZV64_60240 [Ignavibacteriales bacterium]|nr:hypothetical protein [Ignavibacteriales bacterium]